MTCRIQLLITYESFSLLFIFNYNKFPTINNWKKKKKRFNWLVCIITILSQERRINCKNMCLNMAAGFNLQDFGQVIVKSGDICVCRSFSWLFCGLMGALYPLALSQQGCMNILLAISDVQLLRSFFFILSRHFNTSSWPMMKGEIEDEDLGICAIANA